MIQHYPALLVFSPYYPPHVGGLQSHTQQFNQELAKSGTKITTFTSQLPSFSPPHENVGLITIIRFPAWEIIPNYPLPKFWQSSFWHNWRFLKKQRHDIVISRTRFFVTSLLAFFYSKSTKTPWLHIEHGSDFVSLANPIANLLARSYDYTLGRFVLSQADKIVANSTASANFVQRLSGRTASVIYRGLDQEKIISLPPANHLRHQYKNKIIITYIGRLIDGKGVNDLLHALKAVDYKLKTNSYHCLIIGDGPQKNSLTKLAQQLGINDHITFLGQKNFRQAMTILKASDIFVNPSHTEGLPTTVIEAALCRTAIVATNVGGTPEIITNNESGYLLPPRQPKALAEKLMFLIQNPDQRTSLTQRAYQEVLPKFSWPKSLIAYHKIFQQMLQS